jgi:hypothetical protein
MTAAGTACYVATLAIRAAVRGCEGDVLDALGIDWRRGNPHISCPYPDHDDRNPSWRWDERRSRAYCSCSQKPETIFDVVMRVRWLDFNAAKVCVAELLGRGDLIKIKSSIGGQKTDPSSLLSPPPTNRDDRLVGRYLAARLGIEDPAAVPLPSTQVAGWRSLGYYDPPEKKGAKPKLVASPPCAIFETVAADGRRHAHRIYLNPTGDAKAKLGVTAGGKQRDPKKSARLAEGQPSTAGCCVLWGDPGRGAGDETDLTADETDLNVSGHSTTGDIASLDTSGSRACAVCGNIIADTRVNVRFAARHADSKPTGLATTGPRGTCPATAAGS